ncbi:hypothetical protein BT96DRAFT_1026945 [Gymnopus androsaceus JB14]|uniref:Uncharacterized protein n=1 Tax=Gymnopus androsaceus JB14 TaxID=1447944 RepID=A0A6A4GFT5_9AGAR|nr:hypothetical protein BT96DRAFT_1026945 [Gymnopus androsaceus JB14]
MLREVIHYYGFLRCLTLRDGSLYSWEVFPPAAADFQRRSASLSSLTLEDFLTKDLGIFTEVQRCNFISEGSQVLLPKLTSLGLQRIYKKPFLLQAGKSDIHINKRPRSTLISSSDTESDLQVRSLRSTVGQKVRLRNEFLIEKVDT